MERSYTFATLRPATPEWNRLYSPAAKAKEATKWAKIKQAEAWARSKPFAKMHGAFWHSYKARLVAAGASEGLVESYIDELKDERACDIAWDTRHKND